MTTPHSPDSRTEEQVVLLDRSGNPIGTMDKSRVHSVNTPLHSAFSIFLFDGLGNMLTQQRAQSKKTWPGVWSNACCGHPQPEESHLAAAHRRLREELGIEGLELKLALPNFRYKAVKDGVMENEICPVFIGLCPPGTTINPNPAEVEQVEWVTWNTFAKACDRPQNTAFKDFSPWSLLEGRLLKISPCLSQLLAPVD